MRWRDMWTWVSDVLVGPPSAPRPGCPCNWCRSRAAEQADRAARRGESAEVRARRVEHSTDLLRAEVQSCEQAEVRARGLLLSCLDAVQTQAFLSEGAFEVTARPSGHRYRIEPNWQGNIVCTHGPFGFVGRRFCIVQRRKSGGPWIPLHDHLLMQKLLIEADEARFLATAF